MVQQADRQKNYKKAIGEEDGVRRRQETAVSIRKNKREEGLAKRRAGLINNITNGELEKCASAEGGASLAPAVANANSIPGFVAGLRATDPALVVEACRGLRKLLSAEVNPPVLETMNAGAVPMLVALLGSADPVLQFESAWALTNIASTEYTRVVVDAGAIPPMVALLTSANAEVREQAAWCIGNIAGDGVAYRDLCLQHQALNGILLNIQHPHTETMLRNCVWSLSNFCRGKPQTPLSAVGAALPAIAHVLQCNDNDVVMDACWAASYLSDGPDDRIQACVAAGLAPLLVARLGSTVPSVVTPALRAVGNLVSGDDQATQAVVDAGALPLLAPLVQRGTGHPAASKRGVRKEACWALSNVAAGSRTQIGALLAVPGLIDGVLQAVIQDEWEVRKEAAWVISNICTGGSTPQIRSLIDRGVIPAVCELLHASDSKVVLIALEALSHVLATGDDRASGLAAPGHGRLDLVEALEAAGGVDKIEELQEHENQEVYEKAVEMIEKYMGEEEDGVDGDENMAPAVSGDGNAKVFSFGAPGGAAPASFGALPSGGFGVPSGGFNFAGGAPLAPLGEHNNFAAPMFGFAN